MARTKRPQRPRRPWGADGYFSAGLVVVLLTGLLALVTSDDASTARTIAYVGGVVAGLFVLVGVVAKGVEAGIRASRD